MNIGDIARMAGVSKATISRYLNDGYVSEDKKKIIGKIIKETGFKPSSHAITLRTKKTGIIGVIIPKISSESIGRMVEGISTVLKKRGYKLLLANTFNDEKEEMYYLKTLCEYNVDGIILLGTILTQEHRKCIQESSVPLVVLAQRLENHFCVYYNDFQAAKMVTEIICQTAKKIAYIGVFRKDIAAGESRFQGFISACKEKGISPENQCFLEIGFDMESGYEAAKQVFSKMPEVDSIFCATDSIALGVIKYIQEIGKKIPEEVQIVGMGNHKVSNVIFPALTTVEYSYHMGGVEAANLLLKIMGHERVEKPEQMLECQVVERGSTRKE